MVIYVMSSWKLTPDERRELYRLSQLRAVDGRFVYRSDHLAEQFGISRVSVSKYRRGLIARASVVKFDIKSFSEYDRGLYNDLVAKLGAGDAVKYMRDHIAVKKKNELARRARENNGQEISQKAS